MALAVVVKLSPSGDGGKSSDGPSRDTVRLKTALVDFDGTLVDADVLDHLCGVVGKAHESRHLGRSCGLDSLVARINLLEGLSLDRIREEIELHDFLDPGARDLVAWLKRVGLTVILHSGNLVQVLAYYQEQLGFDAVVGSEASMIGGKVRGISIDAYPCEDFKLHGCKQVLERLSIPPHEVTAIGDSPADIPLFRFCGRERSIAKRPKEEHRELLRRHVSYFVEDLFEARRLIQQMME